MQVYAAASFLLAQKIHMCSNSIQRVAAFFLDAACKQAEGNHSVLLAQSLHPIMQLRQDYARAKDVSQKASGVDPMHKKKLDDDVAHLKKLYEEKHMVSLASLVDDHTVIMHV